MGVLVLDLLEHPSWILRRVETIEILDLRLRRRSVSLQLDLREYRRRARLHGVADNQPALVPLALIPKGLLLDFDVRDSGGSPLPLVTSDIDSHLAMQVLLAAAERAGIRRARFSKRLLDHLHTHIASFQEPDDGDPAFPRVTDPKFVKRLGQEDAEVWAALQKDKAAKKLLIDFGELFLAVTTLDSSRNDEVVKHARIENESDSTVQLFEEMPLSATPFTPQKPVWPIVIRAHDVGRASREHLRIVAPAGTELSSSLLFPVPGRHDRGSVNLEYSARLTPERSVIYTSNVPSGDYYVVATLVPKLAGFINPAQILTGTASALLIAGAYSEVYWAFIRRLQEFSDAAVTTLLVVPTVLIAYIIRDNEHPTRRRLLRGERIVTLLTMVPIFAAVLTLFLNPDRFLPWVFTAIWAASGVVAAGLFARLTVVRIRVNRRSRFTAKSATETQTLAVTIEHRPWQRSA